MNENYSCDSCSKDYTTREGLAYHYDNSDCERNGVDCPECGDTFANEHGVRAHHSQVHGGPGIHGTKVVECAWCSKEIRRKKYFVEKREKFYCSTECEAEWKSEYQGAYRWADDKTHYSGSYYGSNWPEQRAKRLEIDDYQCVACGMTDEEHKEQQGRSLSVHHLRDIDEFRDSETNSLDEKEANEISNLVTMCRPCHKKWEGVPITPDNRAISDLTSAGALAVSELTEDS